MKTTCVVLVSMFFFASVCLGQDVELFGPSIKGTYLAGGSKIRFIAARVSGARFNLEEATNAAHIAHQMWRDQRETAEAGKNTKMPLGSRDYAIIGFANETTNKWAWDAIRVVDDTTTQFFTMRGERGSNNGWQHRYYYADGSSGTTIHYQFADNDDGKLGFVFDDPNPKRIKESPGTEEFPAQERPAQAVDLPKGK